VIVLEIVSFLSLVFWILLTLDRSRNWPAEVLLPEAVTLPTTQSDLVVAIVPARNEADLLPATLPALLGQEGVSMRVILVDDGSTDGTAAVARQVAESTGRGDRLEVIEAGKRPRGWTGKVHALHRGYQAAGTPDWLLLTDADIWHRQGSVLSLLRQAEAGETEKPFDLISVMARLRAQTFWERLIIPAFVFFFQLLYPFRRVMQEGSAAAAAAGGCILIRRQVLETAGGFEAIRGAIIDDVTLAKRIREVGGRLWLGFDPGVCSRREYPRLRDLWQMVSRTAFTQLDHNWALLMVTLLGLAIVVVSPPVVIGLGLLDLVLDDASASRSVIRAMIWAMTAWLLMTRSLRPAVRYHEVAAGWSAALPVSGILYGLMTVTSAWRHLTGKGPSWRG